MTDRTLSAQDFVSVFLLFASIIGRAAALVCRQVQAARRAYLLARGCA